MKKNMSFYILFIVCIFMMFTACSNGDTSKQNDVSNNSSPVVEVSGYGDNDDSNQNGLNSIEHVVSDNFDDWTYTDWQYASEEQRNNCTNFFKEQLAIDISEDNLMKIFATNEGEKLSKIIEIQKSNRSQVESNSNQAEEIQKDPGHGAAAGQQK